MVLKLLHTMDCGRKMERRRLSTEADCATAGTRTTCMSPFIDLDSRTKICSNLKCYSDLCALNKTRGAVVAAHLRHIAVQSAR
ncbi:hypothetical protein A8M32_18470 [Sinorhizobium alkalisoli]|uniref:Uncharacterized protein n=1 Tax=Sinorhizobium alkalisoli TaxID=1752398 RepID=A0A1E3V929_9HYPH|nr:hypothetical protein A8M32_18470 [Sinorhizobium alkalisoli]